MDHEHLHEASWVVQAVAGASAHMHGVAYPLEKFKKELAATMQHVRRQEKRPHPKHRRLRPRVSHGAKHVVA